MSAAKNETRSLLVATKVTEAERDRIDLAAQQEGISRSDVIRRAVLRDLGRPTRAEGDR